eukprot:Lithocolla_globosa_v1_NODE_2695_length_1901_cov_748.919285.p3 type:complete len:103 gc:universal NODE_2695_length_1901_cov_748.919285:1745-1437(-)
MEPGLIESTKSMTATELEMLESLKPVIEEDFPAFFKVSLVQSMISWSEIRPSPPASLLRMERVCARIICQTTARVKVLLPSKMSLPPIPTMENFISLPSSTA